jgi:hypothetical protein
MTINLRTVRADTILAGDQFLHEEGHAAWTAISDARKGYIPGERAPTAEVGVCIDVQHHPDGGLDTRWFPADMEWSEKLVRRAEPVEPPAA